MHQRSGRKTHYIRAVAWILISFALLAAGVIAGAVAGKGLQWILPVAGFVGYVLAMRHGLCLWNPDGLDVVWRSTPATGPRRSARSTNFRVVRFRGESGRRPPMSPEGPTREHHGRC